MAVSPAVFEIPSPLQEVRFDDCFFRIKRDDLIHHEVSGNKWRKLKYNVENAKRSGCTALLTFGGPYSNHIAATAAAGSMLGIRTMGIIRGEEAYKTNPTLSKAHLHGMELHFLSRSAYRELRLNNAFEDFAQKFDGVYIVPEGGANLAGAKGCAEIIAEFDRSPAHIVLAGGTGTTAAGLLMAISPGSTVHLIPVLKGGAYLREPIASMLAQTGNTNKIEALHIHSEFHCGGYGKATIGLLAFKKKFESATEIRLDRIYTAKAMWAMVQLMELGVLPSNGEAVFLHTGGLQGDTPV